MDGGGQNGVEGGRRRRVEIVGGGLVGGVEWYGEECGKRGKAVVRSVVKQCRAARGLVGDGTGKPLLGARSHGILNFCLLKLKTELYFPEF